jgi:hypothetical protein
MFGFMLGVLGLFIITAVSVLAARAEESLWRECKRRESARQLQQQISVGKSRLR